MSGNRINRNKYYLGLVTLLLLLFLSPRLHAGSNAGMLKRLGPDDALLVADPDGKKLFSQNTEKLLIPASTLKIFTALVALQHLGADFKFKTEFYRDIQGNLKIKGYGDPLLISEVLVEIAGELGLRIKTYEDLILDDTYFDRPLTIPGITSSLQPYDAPNGALCVNFNTVYFKKKKNGAYISAEPQTPLLPYVQKRIKKSNLDRGRIIFSQQGKDITRYAGHLFQYFFAQAGITGRGNIRIGKIDETSDRLVYTYRSRFTLETAISKLMAYSNNFISNQLLIAAGAAVFGRPGNLDKAVNLAKKYAENRFGIDTLRLVEGSGISRENLISAEMLYQALEVFKPYAHLLRYETGIYYKTGTLAGISTRAGYMVHSDEKLYPFVVLLNSKGRTAAAFMDSIRHIIERKKSDG